MLFGLTIWELAAIGSKFLAYGGSFVAAGSVLFTSLNGKGAADIRRVLGIALVVAVFIGIIGSVSQFAVQSGRLMDDGLDGMMDPDMIELVSDGPLGTAVYLRVIGLALLPVFLILRGPLALVLGAIGVVLVAASFSFVGHSTGEPRWLLGSLVTVHVLAVSFWIGALLPLYVLAHRKRDIGHAGRLAHRFGKQAAFVVAVLVLAGGTLTWFLVGSPDALFGTQYGQTLVVKLIVVAGLLGLAAANKLRFVPAMMTGDGAGARHLRHSIRWEALAIATILLVSAVLTTVTALPIGMNDAPGATDMEHLNHEN